MEQEKDIIEQIKQLPDKAPIYPGLTQKASELTKKKYCRCQIIFAGKLRRYLTIGAAFLIFVALAVVPIAIHYSSLTDTPSDRYIIGDELATEKIDCTEDAVYYSNGKTGKYFPPSITQTVLIGYFFIDNNELAYLLQQTLFLTEDSIDVVKLAIIFSDNKFSDLQIYELCDQTMTVENLSVSYYIIDQTTSTEIYSSFVKDDVRYYMYINSDNIEGKIEKYVGLLFS